MVPAVNTVTECGPETNFPCPRLPLKIFLSSGIPSWDVGDISGTLSDLHRTSYPVEFHQVQEGHTWDNWRGLSDEMLIYFFGTD
jgi:enterochelin esterase family protein